MVRMEAEFRINFCGDTNTQQQQLCFKIIDVNENLIDTLFMGPSGGHQGP